MSKNTLDKYFSLIQKRPFEFKGNEIKIITERATLEEYEYKNNCDLGLIYESAYHILLKDLVIENNIIFPYERILKQSPYNSVVMIPMFENKFILLKQYRHSMRDFQLCFPRGFGEPNITIIENAKKELYEELGCNLNHVHKFGEVVADSGICGEKVSVLLCQITAPILKKDYEGIKEIKFFEFDELISLIKSNTITDGYTLSAISLYLSQQKII